MGETMITKKVVLVGDFATGKTSLIRRYVDNQFSDEYLTTIGVKISKKSVSLSAAELKVDIQLMIWDIEGNTTDKPTNPAYIMGAHGLVIVADCTREKSIANIGMHLEECRKVLKDVPIFLAINKSDLIKDEDKLKALLSGLKDEYEALEFAYATSAKEGTNVETMFIELAQSMIATR